MLVSIGYSACHWCHVMERESFEDEATAQLMNERFVCIKVDREEHPDVDAIYMDATQAMTGAGGWPLNAFLTPDGVPFWCGTYFPPEPRQGMPSWRNVLTAIGAAWDEQREEIRGQAGAIVERLRGAAALKPPEEEVDPASLDAAVAGLRKLYDPEYGGFGGAPKFPPSSTIEFLLGRGEREMALHTLRRMASGGMYDQVGGGFARYSVDRTWLVPHFEKMLYDNALLARAYVHAWQVTGDPLFERVARETLDWALAELRQEEGAFASALDADSEGVEGKFYVWTLPQVREVLGDELADEAIEHFGMTEQGNFEGANIPVRATPDPPHRDELRSRLYEARAQRVWPGLDDKRLTGWNALMISALADAASAFDDADVPRRGGALRRLPRHPHARRGRPAAAHLQPRPGAAARGARGPRLPARGADRALPGDVRPALVRRGAGARRHDHRALLRRRERRLLLDRRRPRAADHAPQGHRGQPDPGRPVGGRARAAAARRADRRVPLRGGRARRDRGSCTRSRPQHPPRSATCCRRSTSTSPPCARSRSWGPTAARSSAWCARASAPTSCWRAARPTACRCSRGASRSTAAPPPTSASASCASGR